MTLATTMPPYGPHGQTRWVPYHTHTCVRDDTCNLIERGEEQTVRPCTITDVIPDEAHARIHRHGHEKTNMHKYINDGEHKHNRQYTHNTPTNTTHVHGKRTPKDIRDTSISRKQHGARMRRQYQRLQHDKTGRLSRSRMCKRMHETC